jgi:hypothetical protein
MRKGTPRPESYGTGRASRRIPSIDEVYAAEELPSLPEPTNGEHRTVEQACVSDFVYKIHNSHRVPRGGRKQK